MKFGYTVEDETKQTVDAETGRVTIGSINFQIDFGLPAHVSRENGTPSVTSYCFAPSSVPDGIDPQTNISITTNGSQRFAMVPVSLLSQAVPTGSQAERTRQMLTLLIAKASSRETPDPTLS